MTWSTIDVTARLDRLQHSLPPIPAKSMAFGRAVVRHTNDLAISVVSDVARRTDHLVRSVQRGDATTSGQGGSAAGRTIRTGRDGARDTAAQARSAAGATRDAARGGARETVGRARRQVGDLVDTAGETAEELIDDATDAVDDADSRGSSYDDWTKAELYERAQELDVEGRSTMSKDELIEALRST